MISPVALLGAIFFQYVSGLSLDIYAQVGLVMLIGLSTKQAILIVEFAKDAMEGVNGQPGLNYIDAAMQAAKLRFRAVMMTNIAFILGLLPLVFAHGAGAGSIQLSYNATRKRYTNVRASARIGPICPDDCCSCNEVPDQAKSISLGRISSEILVIAFIASPELTPEAGFPLIVIAGYILNLVNEYGPTILVVDITADNGTIFP